jgi:hypothetical protein
MQHLDDGALQAWLDGPRSGLSASEREEIQRHLSSCEACARRLAGLNESSLRVQTLLSGPESADETVPAFETVLARARQRQGLGRRRPRWAAAAWAASIAAAIGLGWLGSNLYRGGGVTRTAVEATKTDSAAPVVAAATPARDTSPTLQGAAGTPTQPAALTHPAAPVVVAAKPAEDTSPRGGTARASARLSTPVKTAARPATSVASAEKAAAEVSLPAQPVPAEVAERLVAHAADAVPSDSSPTFIRGRVTDESGRPLAAAQVVAEGTGAGAITGKDGTFELSLHRSPADSATRPVTLTAQLIGYRTESRKLDTHAGNVVSADFHLVPQDVALNEMVVSGVSARARENAPRQEIVVPLDQPRGVRGEARAGPRRRPRRASASSRCRTYRWSGSKWGAPRARRWCASSRHSPTAAASSSWSPGAPCASAAPRPPRGTRARRCSGAMSTSPPRPRWQRMP